MTLALSLNTSILGLPPLAWWAILVIVSFVAFFAVALCKAAAELTEVRGLFPRGVCDYSKPGVGQAPTPGTWLSLNAATLPAKLQ